MLILDSYAWVEYFLGSEKGMVVKEHLNREPAITPDVVLAEVARKYMREGISGDNIKKRLYFIAAKSDIAVLDVDLSLAAAETWQELARDAKFQPSLTDGIVLATARRHQAKVLTGDLHFRGLKEVLML
jgi:predicted nucleic acid-binding protein